MPCTLNYFEISDSVMESHSSFNSNQMYYFQMFLPQTRNIIFFCLGRNFDRPSEPTASYKHFIGRNAVPLKMTKFNLFVFSFPGLSRFNGLDRLIRPKFKSNVLLRFFFHLQEMHFFYLVAILIDQLNRPQVINISYVEIQCH